MIVPWLLALGLREPIRELGQPRDDLLGRGLAGLLVHALGLQVGLHLLDGLDHEVGVIQDQLGLRREPIEPVLVQGEHGERGPAQGERVAVDEQRQELRVLGAVLVLAHPDADLHVALLGESDGLAGGGKGNGGAH